MSFYASGILKHLGVRDISIKLESIIETSIDDYNELRKVKDLVDRVVVFKFISTDIIIQYLPYFDFKLLCKKYKVGKPVHFLTRIIHNGYSLEYRIKNISQNVEYGIGDVLSIRENVADAVDRTSKEHIIINDTSITEGIAKMSRSLSEYLMKGDSIRYYGHKYRGTIIADCVTLNWNNEGSDVWQGILIGASNTSIKLWVPNIKPNNMWVPMEKLNIDIWVKVNDFVDRYARFYFLRDKKNREFYDFKTEGLEKKREEYLNKLREMGKIEEYGLWKYIENEIPDL